MSHWRISPRLFDLRRLRWIDGVRVPRTVWQLNRLHPPRLTADGHLLHGDFSQFGRDSTPFFIGIRRRNLRDDTSVLITADPAEHGTAIASTRDLFWYVTQTQKVAVISRDAETASHFEPLPRKVIHAAFVDAERMLLVAGSWCELVIHRIHGETLEYLLRVEPEGAGEVTWAALAGSWLVMAVTTGRGSASIEMFDVTEADGRWTASPVRSHGSDPVGAEHSSSAAVRAASLSRDGRFLAVGFERRLVVYELGTGNMQTFDEHTDRINLVRFVGDDHVLVSADDDNRVVMRPRTTRGYAVALVEAEIPADERVPL